MTRLSKDDEKHGHAIANIITGADTHFTVLDTYGICLCKCFLGQYELELVSA
jgi:hypothetical protein